MAIGDLDGDGWQDVIAAGHIEETHVFRNDGGTFTDITAYSGIDTSAFDSSVALGDTDNDGMWDVVDEDDDNDGIPTSIETDENSEFLLGCPNPDALPNHLDDDSDGDGLLDVEEGHLNDGDDDGIPDFLDCNDAGCAEDADGEVLEEQTIRIDSNAFLTADGERRLVLDARAVAVEVVGMHESPRAKRAVEFLERRVEP